jgi:uncharacterized phage protein (TIGR01671 family)
MRTIKFRGKSIDNEKWIYGGFFNSSEEEGLVSYVFDNINGAEPVEINSIGQFTGMKDRNGIDIYEGDIVNSGAGEILWCELESMFKVKWHGEVFKRVRGQNDRYTLNGEPLFMNAHIAWEVIGNIHENPQLLSTPTAVL